MAEQLPAHAITPCITIGIAAAILRRPRHIALTPALAYQRLNIANDTRAHLYVAGHRNRRHAIGAGRFFDCLTTADDITRYVARRNHDGDEELFWRRGRIHAQSYALFRQLGIAHHRRRSVPSVSSSPVVLYHLIIPSPLLGDRVIRSTKCVQAITSAADVDV